MGPEMGPEMGLRDPRTDTAVTLARSGETERFVRELAHDLRPVRRIAPFWHAAGVVVLLWLAGAGGVLALKGLRPDLRDAISASLPFATVLAALVLVAIGGVGAAIGESVPGRTGLARASLAAGLAGVVAALGACALLLRGARALPVDPISADLACLGLAGVLALPPGIGVLRFAGRAAPFRPLLVVLLAAAGTTALAASAVHLTCAYGSARHLIVGHTLAPVAGALLLAVPYRAALSRVARWPGGGVPPP